MASYSVWRRSPSIPEAGANGEIFIATTHFHAEHTTGYLAFPSTAKYVNSTVQEAEFAAEGPQMIQTFSRRSPLTADLLKDATVTAVSADDTYVTVLVEEKHAVIGTSKLMMMFGAKDFQLKQWVVTDPQGYDTTVAVYNLDNKLAADPKFDRYATESFLKDLHPVGVSEVAA